MSNDQSNRDIRGVDRPADLKTLTRVSESQVKRTGSNPEPATAKPLNFAPPGQAAPAPTLPATAPAPAQSSNTSSGESAG
jgi:hypothetical protein